MNDRLAGGDQSLRTRRCGEGDDRGMGRLLTTRSTWTFSWKRSCSTRAGIRRTAAPMLAKARWDAERPESGHPDSCGESLYEPKRRMENSAQEYGVSRERVRQMSRGLRQAVQGVVAKEAPADRRQWAGKPRDSARRRAIESGRTGNAAVLAKREVSSGTPHHHHSDICVSAAFPSARRVAAPRPLSAFKSLDRLTSRMGVGKAGIDDRDRTAQREDRALSPNPCPG